MASYSDLFGVDQPVALVTGSAAPRVGQVIAKDLARKGCRVAIHGNHSVDEGKELVESLRSQNHKAEFFQADLSMSGEPDRLVREVIERLGRIDIVVNSAAIWYPTPLEEVDQSEVEKYLQVNSVACFMIAKAAGLRMTQQEKGGVIINIGDWAPTRPYVDYSAYFLSKGNLPTMVRMLAVELGTRKPGIRVNAVLPGPVMIPDDIPGELREQIIEATLLKREGSPQNVSDACLALIENDFINGVCLPVDGGRTIYSPFNPV